MALRIDCDGCGAVLPLHGRPPDHPPGCRGCQAGHDGTTIGRLDPADYCPACVLIWHAYEAAEHAARVEATRQFEGWRREGLRGVRRHLRKLPDDPGDGDPEP